MTKILTNSERRRLYLELKEGDRKEIKDPNKKAQVLKYINSEIKRLTRLKINIASLNPRMKNYRMEQIPEFKHLIRIKKMIEGEPKTGRKKTEINPDLRLADVLIEGESVAEVKSHYNFRGHTSIYLGKFLRILAMMGYFKRKLTSKEYEAIGRNDFDDATYNDRNNYKPPALEDLYRYPEFRIIPRPKRAKML